MIIISDEKVFESKIIFFQIPAMDLSELESLTEKQEQVISELEQELCDLLLEKEKLAGA